ncbi:mCG148117 [Mus musculus]|uniref:Uncharacterized protein n=2 Tax=Mus TaxID=862507 RepID=Q8CF28_MOUSE|nr:mCG148117 [Mus musculus]BAC25150.1 unnamed protein product [Mus musculus]
MAPDTCFLSTSTPLRTGRAGSGKPNRISLPEEKQKGSSLQRLEVASAGLSLVKVGPWGELKG